MSYFVLNGASQRTKTFTSFALAALMIFQAFGPGVFALKTANATAIDPTTIDVCHKTGQTWNHLNTPNVNSYNAHIGHGDFDYVGPENVSNNDKDAWCASNAPQNIVDVCLNIDGVQATVPDGYTNNDGTCAPIHPPVDVCNNIPDNQATIPEGLISDGHGGCVENGNPQENPNDATLYATKVVCDSEADLPNWAGNEEKVINSTTATDYVAQSDGKCHLESNWQFETAYRGPNHSILNPVSSGSDTGPAGGDWTTMPNVTNEMGVTSINFDVTNTWHLWVREVLQDGYIPFSDGPADPSAEMYCDTDVTNYDNLEVLNAPFQAGAKYYCVAFNVPKGDVPQEVEPCLIPVTVLPGDKITTIGASNGPEVTLQSVLDTKYPPANTVDDITSETGIQAWNIPVGTNTVTVNAKLLSASAGNSNELGYYFDGDTSTFVSLFVVPGNTNPAIDTGSVVIPTLGHTKIAIALKSGANTYASQYTLNAGNEDHAAVYEPVTGTYAIAFEDLPFSSADKDYNDLVAEIKIVGCNGGTQCVPGSGSVVSDTTVNNVTDGNIPAVALTFVHPAWTANIPGATWIWATNPVVAPTDDADLTKVFTKTFTITGTPTSGTLDIAVDNNYSVKVNGNVVPVVFDQNNFQLGTQDSYNVLPFLTTGLNTIEITATNQEIGQDADPAANPAGVLFELSWASNCDGGGSSDEDTSTITIHKYIDGQPATSELAGETTFNVETVESWAGELPGNSNGVRNLSVDNNYTYTSHPLVDEHNTFIANEVIGGDIIGPEAECAPGKFKLAGYSFGPTLNDAFTSASTTAAHQFENISSNQHVIVWNDACPTTAHVTATKIVCTNEADLPNFGNGTGAPISATTATDWISEAHPSCSLQPDWTFQWAPSGTSNPGDNTGTAGAPWTSTGATIANGTISFDVPVVTNGGYVWMREIMKPGYIPFTGQNTTQDISAEIYCGIDHLNFDNYDRIDNLVAGNNYNCVAWNVPIQGDGGPRETKTFATTTIFATDLAADIPAVILAPTKWFFYNDETDAIDNVLGSFVFGPNTAPLGNGSAQMSVTGTQRRNIATYQFSNVKLSNIKALRFSTNSESAGNGSPASERSAYLHFNVSFDGVDSWQKRLVYVPSVNGAVTNDSWQSWDAIDGGNGLWLYSGATWPSPNAIPGTTPKTWAQILTDYPNIQTRTTDSWMGLRVGEPYNDGFTGEVDNFVIAIKSGLNTHTQTFDFEPTPRNEDCNDCGGGNNTPTETLIPAGGSGSRSGQQRGGSVAGASTNVPQVLGASTDVPSMPDTGNGASSNTLLIALSIFGALIAVNAITIRKMRNS